MGSTRISFLFVTMKLRSGVRDELLFSLLRNARLALALLVPLSLNERIDCLVSCRSAQSRFDLDDIVLTCSVECLIICVYRVRCLAWVHYVSAGVAPELRA